MFYYVYSTFRTLINVYARVLQTSFHTCQTSVLLRINNQKRFLFNSDANEVLHVPLLITVEVRIKIIHGNNVLVRI